MSEKTYRIGEAAALLNLKTYVLRFWEVEFPQIMPMRTEKGQRLYSEKDVDVLRRIRFLLHERGLTIEGARRILAEEVARGQDGKHGKARAKPDGTDASPDVPPSRAPSDHAGTEEQMQAHEKALLHMLAMPEMEAAAAGIDPDLYEDFAREVAEELRVIRKLLVPE